MTRDSVVRREENLVCSLQYQSCRGCRAKKDKGGSYSLPEILNYDDMMCAVPILGSQGQTRDDVSRRN